MLDIAENLVGRFWNESKEFRDHNNIGDSKKNNVEESSYVWWGMMQMSKNALKILVKRKAKIVCWDMKSFAPDNDKT